MAKSMTSTPKKVNISARIPASIWKKTVNKASYNGVNASYVITKFLTKYVEGWEMKDLEEKIENEDDFDISGLNL